MIATDIDAAFTKFDTLNPRVWFHFERFTLMAIEAGREHYSADAICHRIRWHIAIDTKSEDDFKINDHYTSRYARKWAEAHPEQAEFFETRTLRSGAGEPGPFGRGTVDDGRDGG